VAPFASAIEALRTQELGGECGDMKKQIRKDRFAFLQTFAKMFYGVGFVTSPVSEALLEWTFILAVMASPKATIDCIDAFGKTDFRNDLASFTIPTLIIHGTSDKTVPIDPAGRAAAKGIASAKLLEYEGEPHGLFATVPDRLNADLIAFSDNRTACPRLARQQIALTCNGSGPRSIPSTGTYSQS
jgi:pimeloyl-ACP methyl ester carboxylesterase